MQLPFWHSSHACVFVHLAISTFPFSYLSILQSHPPSLHDQYPSNLHLSIQGPTTIVHHSVSTITMSSDPTLAVPLDTGRPGASRTSSSQSVQRSVERIDDRQDLGTVVKRGVSPAADSAVEVGAGSAADERPTSIAIPATKPSSTGDLRSGLASPVIPDGAIQ